MSRHSILRLFQCDFGLAPVQKPAGQQPAYKEEHQ